MNTYFGEFSEIDLIYNFIKVYQAFGIAICAGEIRETDPQRIIKKLKSIEK